jgi:hypothetical protein
LFASGAIIYAYVSGNPVNDVDPLGLNPGNYPDDGICRGLLCLIMPIINPEPVDPTDGSIDDLLKGTIPELDERGRERPGQYVKPDGDIDADKDSIQGETGSNGQKVSPDGSVSGEHRSTSKQTRGQRTLHIIRPKGKQDIKIRYPNC